MSHPEVRNVDQQTHVSAALEWLGDLDPIGVDVERADSDRYYRSAALVQIGGNGKVALLDPLTLTDWTEIAEFLRSKTVLLHAMQNDIPPLEALGIALPKVEDSGLAAAFLALPKGLENLLNEILGIELGTDKHAMQRADWELRPLTEEMQVYAAGDVADLPELWQELRNRLEEAGRWAWYVEERDAIRAQPSAEERRSWKRTKGIGRLDPKSRARVKSIWEAREAFAQESDTAPGRVLHDKVLVEFALNPPTNVRELGRRGMRRQAIGVFGEDVIAAAAVEGNEPVTRTRRSRRATEQDRLIVDDLRVIRSEIAKEVGLDVGFVCPSRTLMAAVVKDPCTAEELHAAFDLREWQWELVGERFCERVLQGDAGVNDEEE